MPSSFFYLRESDSLDSAWVLYTVIGTCVLLTLIALVVLYDLCCRYRDYRDQQITDGGPPASPGHHQSYLIAIRADEASPEFDTNQSVICLEFLDQQNQYITSLAIPCFIFKFRTNEQQLGKETQQQEFTKLTDNQEQKLVFKSLSGYHDIWSSTMKSNLITFYLVRRNPMQNLSRVRISHDCYLNGAYVTFRYILIRDEAYRQCGRVNLYGRPLKARHPCPPSSYQVFDVDRQSSLQQIEESKSYVQLFQAREITVILAMYVEITLFLNCMGYKYANPVRGLRIALILGSIAGLAAGSIMAVFTIVLLQIKRMSMKRLDCLKLPLLLLTVGLVTNSCLCGYGFYLCSDLDKSYETFGVFILYYFISFLIGQTIMMVSLILATVVLANIRTREQTIDSHFDNLAPN